MRQKFPLRGNSCKLYLRIAVNYTSEFWAHFEAAIYVVRSCFINLYEMKQNVSLKSMVYVLDTGGIAEK